jgi:hypothetical protein
MSLRCCWRRFGGLSASGSRRSSPDSLRPSARSRHAARERSGGATVGKAYGQAACWQQTRFACRPRDSATGTIFEVRRSGRSQAIAAVIGTFFLTAKRGRCYDCVSGLRQLGPQPVTEGSACKIRPMVCVEERPARSSEFVASTNPQEYFRLTTNPASIEAGFAVSWPADSGILGRRMASREWLFCDADLQSRRFRGLALARPGRRRPTDGLHAGGCRRLCGRSCRAVESPTCIPAALRVH